MKQFSIWKSALAIGLIVSAVPAASHHSFAMFDQTKPAELKKVIVVRFAWANPHVFVVVKNGQTTYTLECSSPALLQREGWKFNTLKVGDRIDVVFNPLRNGKPGGALTLATLPDGRKLVAG